MTCPHSHPQSPVWHQHLPLLGLPRPPRPLARQVGRRGNWPLPASVRRILPPSCTHPGPSGGGVRRQRSRVTELGSRGQRRGGPPAEGARGGSERAARSRAGRGGPARARSPVGSGRRRWLPRPRRRRPSHPAHTSSLSPRSGPHSASTANPRAPGEVPALREASSHAIGHWAGAVKPQAPGPRDVTDSRFLKQQLLGGCGAGRMTWCTF